MRIKSKEKGLTFVELLVVIGVISTGVMAAIAMITHAFSATVPLSDKLTASYLVQEGAESVRRIRDSEWLQGENWEEEGIGRVDYDSEEIEMGSGDDFFNLYVDENGIFSHDSGGSDSGFKREIEIEKSSEEDYYLFVTVTVFWDERGEEQKREAYVKLYRWYD